MDKLISNEMAIQKKKLELEKGLMITLTDRFPSRLSRKSTNGKRHGSAIAAQLTPPSLRASDYGLGPLVFRREGGRAGLCHFEG